jgi:uncharacterized membrane protein YebE (DUF533 family)
MNLKSVLDQFLSASGAGGQNGKGIDLGGLASGAAAGGVMGLLLGSKSGRKFIGNAATYGGLAVVGGLAYKALKDWQASKSGSAPVSSAPVKAIDYQNTPDEFMPGANAGKLEFAIVNAMISVAKVDGKIDAGEQRKIFEAIEKSPLSAHEKGEIFSRFDRPATVSELASMVDSLEHKSELFVASCLAADPQEPNVAKHLGDLSQALALPPGLASHLQQQAVGS